MANSLELLLSYFPNAKFNSDYNWYEFQDNSTLVGDREMPKKLLAFELEAEQLFCSQVQNISWDNTGDCAVRIKL